jgi:hypothetical protein
MSVSTDGQICFGVILDEEEEYPWQIKEYDDDIDDWWIFDVLGFSHSFEMFTPQGEWIGGKEWPEEKRDQHYQEKRDFEQANPKLPVVLVNYCSGDYPMWILAIPETCNSARRGYPEKFNPSDLIVTDEQKQKLIEFCQKYGVKYQGNPEWYLSSYWG